MEQTQTTSLVKFSYFTNAKNTTPEKEIGIQELCDIVKSDPAVKANVDRLRNLKSKLNLKDKDDKRTYQDFKLTNFAGFTPAGLFDTRANTECIYYSQIVHVDLDNLSSTLLIDTLNDVKQNRGIFKTAIFAMMSPGGDGLKIFHAVKSKSQVEPHNAQEYHKFVYDQICNAYVKHNDAYRNYIDTGCHDLARLCFFSHDPSFVVKADFTPFECDENDYRVAVQKHQDFLKCYDIWHFEETYDVADKVAVLEEMLQYLSDKKLSITASYNQWYRVLFAIKKELPDNLSYGYAKRFSQLDKSFDMAEFEVKFNSMKNFKYDIAPGIGTILHYAKSVGFKTRLKNNLTANDRFSNLVHSLCKRNIVIRKNVFKNCLEIFENGAYVNFTDDHFAYLHTVVAGQNLKQSDLRSFIDAHVPKYDPVAEFIRTIPKWDGVDRLTDLMSTLNVVENFEFSKSLFKKWCIAFFKQTIDKAANENMIVLQGAQGAGKTRWIVKLFKDFFNDEFDTFVVTKNLNLDRKDDVMVLTQKLVVFNDELAEVLREHSSVAALKATLSQTSYTLRQPYGRYNQDFSRFASVIGAVNDKQLLKDDSGARRFWIIECGNIDYQHGVDVSQFWAQMYECYKNNEPSYLDSRELEIINANNVSYEVQSLEEQLILQYLTVDETKTNLWTALDAHDVLKKFFDEGGLRVNFNVFSRKLSKVFGPSGYNVKKRARISGNLVYAYHIKVSHSYAQNLNKPNVLFADIASTDLNGLADLEVSMQ